MVLKARFLLCCLISAHFSHGVPVDLDYYFTALRSEKSCDSVPQKVDCQIKCGVDTGMCIDSQCYCLSVTKLKAYGVGASSGILPKVLLTRSSDDPQSKDFHDSDETEAKSLEESREHLDESLLSENKPILRHHIAHFCPNLDVARSCIRTCMKIGKPAFCGKDHVCYCGHKYSEHDNKEVDPKDVYGEFRDMYEKYFGPRYKQQINV